MRPLCVYRIVLAAGIIVNIAFFSAGRYTALLLTELCLSTNRKSHMGFRLLPKSVTLNDLERRYFALFY